jgi:hypothetical protein
MTLAILWVTDKTVGLRVNSDEETQGLDMGEHAEAAYEWPWDTISLQGVEGGVQGVDGGVEGVRGAGRSRTPEVPNAR